MLAASLTASLEGFGCTAGSKASSPSGVLRWREEPNELFDEIARRSPTKHLVINTSEFSAAQFLETTREMPDAAPTRAGSCCESGVCDVASPASYHADIGLIRWTWQKALGLARATNAHGGSCRVDIIVNNFAVPPSFRQSVAESFASVLPPVFHEALDRFDLQYTPTGEDSGLLTSAFGERVPLNFVAESTLRNKANKLAKRLARGGILFRLSEGLGVKIPPRVFDVTSTHGFSCEPGDDLTLLNIDDVPVCTAIVMAFYALQETATIVNIIDYRWKCGYRSGALAFNSAFKSPNHIHNFFYPAADDDYFVHDFIRPLQVPRKADEGD